MSYTDYFLKFDNKAAAEAAFLTAGVGVDADGKLPSHTMVGHDAMAIDVLFGTGVVMAPTGNSVIVDGVSVPEMSPSDGYHVNIRFFGSALPASLQSATITPTPTYPKCVFAG